MTDFLWERGSEIEVRLMSFTIERRKVCRFLVSLGSIALASLLFPFNLFGGLERVFWSKSRSRKISRPVRSGDAKIVIARSDRIQTQQGKVDGGVIHKMVDEAVRNLTGKDASPSAWRDIFDRNDIVGIKVNCLGGRMLSPHVELVRAIVAGLRSAGIEEENIIIWDRLTRELRQAGFEINTTDKGVKCLGTDMIGYDRYPETRGSIGSCFSRIISAYCSALISVPVLKDHDLSGVSISMKNFYGAIHNPNKYHDNNCDPYIADLNSHPYIKDKLRLIVCDGIRGVYNGGPGYKAKWSWDYNGLLIGRDPVALDSVGVRIIEEKRKEMGLKSLKLKGNRERTKAHSLCRKIRIRGG